MDALPALDLGPAEPHPEAPPDPSELIAEAENVLGAFLEFPAHELGTNSVGDATLASACHGCAVAPNYPLFSQVAASIYEVSCAASRLVIETGGDWCAVPRVLMRRFDILVEREAIRRRDRFRRLCAYVISARSGNQDAREPAAQIARELADPLRGELLGAAFSWARRAKESACRLALAVRDKELRDRALQRNTRVVQLCGKLEAQLHRLAQDARPWDLDDLVLALKYGLNSTRVQRRLAMLHPSGV